MSDETVTKMYESARDRLRALLRQETEVKEQISHWGPIVEQLARLTRETLDTDIASRINELKQAESGGAGATGAGQEMGLTEAIRWVFRQPLLLPLTPTQVRDRMAEMGYDLSKYKHEMPPIHKHVKEDERGGRDQGSGWNRRDGAGVCKRAAGDLAANYRE